MLSDFISPNLIRLQIHVKNWREAVQASGDLLVDAGICEARYVEAMIAAVERLGPYMVLAPGIALAHARPEDGMLKAGLSIVTLAEPVEFGSVDNDPVCLIIGFGGVDKHGHIQMLQDLAIFLSEESNQIFLKEADDVSSLMAAFQNGVGG